MQVIGLEDGSVIALDMPEPDTAGPTPEDGTLSIPVEAANWVGTVVLSGITFETLKYIATRFAGKGGRRDPMPAASAEQIRDVIVRYLRMSGYDEITFSEVSRSDGQGWNVRGSADGSPFTVRTDERGLVLHVRIK